MRRLGLYLAASVVLLIAVVAYLEGRSVGFPDGHRGEWDEARRVVLLALSVVSFLTSLGFVFLRRIADRRRAFWVLAISYLVVLVSVLAADHFLGQVAGQGG